MGYEGIEKSAVGDGFDLEYPAFFGSFSFGGSRRCGVKRSLGKSGSVSGSGINSLECLEGSCFGLRLGGLEFLERETLLEEGERLFKEREGLDTRVGFLGFDDTGENLSGVARYVSRILSK